MKIGYTGFYIFESARLPGKLAYRYSALNQGARTLMYSRTSSRFLDLVPRAMR